MADIGRLGALNYEMTFPQQPGYAQQQPVAPATELALPDDKDPIALRGKLTSDYYNNVGLLRSFVADMSKKGIDPFTPDYGQEGGGLAHQTLLKLQANVLYSANALGNEAKAETQMRPYLATNQVMLNPNVDKSSLYATDPNSYISAQPLSGTEELNKRLAQETNDPQSQARVNAQIQPYLQNLDRMVQQGYITPEKAEIEKNGIIRNAWRTQPFAPRSGYDGFNPAISAYVSKFSQLATGSGFEPGKKYDETGNRIDVARPTEFVGRQLGFTPDGKKFIVDHFEKTVTPDGFKVEVVDVNDNKQPVDPNNITGSLRNFIETNEGAGALKDLNYFMQTQGLNPATQSVPAQMFAQPQTDVSAQREIAPKVQEIRGQIKSVLDLLSEGGFVRFMKNAVAVGTGNYANIKPTELKFTTGNGQEIIVTKSGDKFNIKNYKDFYPGTVKGGVIEINGEKYPIKGMFEDIDEATLMSTLEDFDVVNVKLKDSKGKEIEVTQTPSQIKAQELINKYRK